MSEQPLQPGAGKMGTHVQRSAGGHSPEHQTQTLTQSDQNLSFRAKIIKLRRKHQLYKPLLFGLTQAVFYYRHRRTGDAGK